jgi:3-phenylpropionate/cinnamic acid dioxygenase small subunit
MNSEVTAGEQSVSTAVSPLSAEREREINLYYQRELRLLDQNDLAAWLELVTPDFTYRVPVPIIRDSEQESGHSDQSFMVDENRQSLANLWVPRQREPQQRKLAWGEYPMQRVRRFVTNIVCCGTRERPEEYEIEANVLVSSARMTEPVVLMPALRRDILRRESGGLKLARRDVLFDSPVMSSTHMRFIV